MALAALLLLFNDPIYMAHLYYPSFATYAITELCSALFVSGILVYWLRELAGYRPRKAEANWSSLKKLIFTCSGVNKCAIVYLITLFFILTINFMVLNCFYYIYVMGDPSLGGKFSNLNESASKNDTFLAPIFVTIFLLLIYYVQFIGASIMGYSRLCDS